MEISRQPLTFSHFPSLPLVYPSMCLRDFSRPFLRTLWPASTASSSFHFFRLSPFTFFFFAILIPANNLIKRFAFYTHVGFVWHVRAPCPLPFALSLHIDFPRLVPHCCFEFSLRQRCWHFVYIKLHAYPFGPRLLMISFHFTSF